MAMSETEEFYSEIRKRLDYCFGKFDDKEKMWKLTASQLSNISYSLELAHRALHNTIAAQLESYEEGVKKLAETKWVIGDRIPTPPVKESSDNE